MALNSGIEWTDHTLNFWIGCKKVSEGCQNCYMFREQKRYGGDPSNIHRTTKATWNNVKKMKSGDYVFVCSWSDFFLSEADPWRDDAWEVIDSRRDLVWILCTKRPENIKGRLPWDKDPWPHVIGMVTVENQHWADIRIPILLESNFAIYGVSIEPMLGSIDLDKWFPKIICDGCGTEMSVLGQVHDMIFDWRDPYEYCGEAILSPGLDWGIAGCESGPNRRETKWMWLADVCSQFYDAGVPFFLKQAEINGKIWKMPECCGRIWDEYPK
jgi:protein gp37